MDKTLKDIILTVTVTKMFLTTTILYTKRKVGKFSTLAIFFRVLFGFYSLNLASISH